MPQPIGSSGAPYAHSFSQSIDPRYMLRSAHPNPTTWRSNGGTYKAILFVSESNISFKRVKYPVTFERLSPSDDIVNQIAFLSLEAVLQS